MVRELKTIFARFGVLETLVTDNGSQFASREFKVFRGSWSYHHLAKIEWEGGKYCEDSERSF